MHVFDGVVNVRMVRVIVVVVMRNIDSGDDRIEAVIPGVGAVGSLPHLAGYPLELCGRIVQPVPRVGQVREARGVRQAEGRQARDSHRFGGADVKERTGGGVGGEGLHRHRAERPPRP